MFVPAPGRFSTTNCWPRYSESFDAARRALMSTPPPGVKPTSTLAGRVGYCASAAAACSAHTRARRAIRALIVSGSEPGALDVERLLDEARQPAAAVFHREDIVAGEHRAEETVGMPVPGRGRIGQLLAVEARVRVHVEVRLRVV